MTPNEVAALRTDLLAFSKHMFQARKGSEFIENWHHRKLCEALERVVIGKSKRLIINIPPRYSKTELAVVNFIAWCMGNFPDSEFIHASYSQRLAANNTWNARALMEHEAYAEIFGKPALRKDSNAKDEYRTESGGVVYATGAGGTITGYGAGKLREDFGGAIIIDDPHKASEATSDTMRQNVIDWFGTTMESRLNSPYTPIIVIMQRLHEEDLAGWLLAGGNGEEWDHIDIPVLDEEDNPLWEFKHDRQKLADMEKANPYVFAGQYMQRPAPKGGGVFKDSWWQYYNVGEEPEMSYRTIYADTAMKTKEHNDYSVFQLWGESGGKVYLLDMLRGKWEAHDLVRIAREFFNRHKIGSGHLRSMRVEDKASGTGLIQTLRSEGVPIQGIPRDKDKYTRALDVVPQIATGNVYLPKQAPWLNELLSEATQFPNAKHDDTLDPLMDAIAEMLISVPGGALFLPARMRKA